MKVLCVLGYRGILEEGITYTIKSMTSKGHYLLEEVDPPKGYGCFHRSRFEDIEEGFPEEQFWLEQPPHPFATDVELDKLLML